MSEKAQEFHDEASSQEERRYSVGATGRRRSTVAELNAGSMLNHQTPVSED
jgi:hypothetical protein